MMGSTHQVLDRRMGVRHWTRLPPHPLLATVVGLPPEERQHSMICIFYPLIVVTVERYNHAWSFVEAEGRCMVYLHG